MNDDVPDPLARTVPAVDVAYQSMVVPAGLVAEITTLPVPHLKPLTGKVGAAGRGLIVAVTAVRVADKHPVVVFLA